MNILGLTISERKHSDVLSNRPDANARGVGSNSGQGAKIPHALGPKNQNIKRKLYCNKFNKDFKNTSS